MVFTSPIFIFLFLPLVFVIYFIISKKSRNLFLLFVSLFFYAWGDIKYIYVMIISIIMNYYCGILIHKYKDNNKVRGKIMKYSILLNLALLVFFKYANFIVDNLNNLIVLLGFKFQILVNQIHLPIGISFFTFQALSYVVDVYREDTEVQKNPMNLALYIALFPQLIAGPIVRYHDIAKEIDDRKVTIDKIAYGIKRFIIGFGKKILIANTLGQVADDIFIISINQISIGSAWLGIICYTLQIYYDFSGYSDMAIGLGRIFGFTFLENFKYPYISMNIKEFWTRWHISLSTWFRDYLYIPLGGSRCSKVKVFRNQILVFLLSGLWHGASWNFVIWGVYHGLFLGLEKTKFSEFIKRLWKPVQHIYAMSVVMIGWVFFRSETLYYSINYIKKMFGFSKMNNSLYFVKFFINPKVVLILFIGVLCATPIINKVNSNFIRFKKEKFVLQYIKDFALFVVFIISILSLASSTYNPFIYFRF